jgi:hypothetical protein
MNHITPCADPANDPEDWFIERDGRQYPDDDHVFNTGSLLADARANGDERDEDEILDEADADAVKAALVRRRHAKDRCHVECNFRTQCLEIALSEPTPATHGTWGGYYQEELKTIRSERDARRARRQARRAPSHDADVSPEE